MQVTKSNGSKEKLDFSKIEAMINFAFEGSGLDSTQLIQKVNIAFYDGIPTRSIQDLIIYEAKLFIKPNQPHNYKWAVIVGRLQASQLHGDIHKNTGFNQVDFVKGYRQLVKQGIYTKKVSKEKLKKLLNFMDLEADFTQPTQSIVSLMNSYLIKDSKGNHIEYPQWAIMADAILTSNGSIEDIERIYKETSSLRLSPATPTKKNLRTGGNTASCFSIITQDSLTDIMRSVDDAAQISKSGGGLAVYVGKIRPSGSDIQKTGNAATHINKWVGFFDQVAGTVDQLGTRSAAITVSNDWFHYDFLEFLEVSTEDGGDLRLKSFDIIPQFLINNYFIQKVKEKQDVYLVNNYDCIKHLGIDLTELVDEEFKTSYEVVLQNLDKIKHKKINAYKLWADIWEVYFKIGKVNITDKDNINSNNYLKAHYKAQTGNLCLESWSINTKEYSHTCNLLSVNLAKIVVDESLLKHSVRTAVDMLHKTLKLSKYPIKTAENSARDLQNIGIGIIGGADWLAYKNMTYNDAGLKELSRVMEMIAFYAYRRSIEIAEVEGSYPLYYKADYTKMFNKTPEELNKVSLNGFDWVSLNKDIRTKGIAHFLLLSPAPNAGTGVVMGASPNYMPVTSTCHFKDMKSITPIIIPPYSDEKGMLYRTKGSFSGKFFLDLTVAIQQWVDTGVSNEIGVNPEIFDMIEFSDTLLDYLLEKKIKTIYYMSETSCTSCAN